MTAKIVVVGSFNADLVSYMERMPRPGETVHGERFATGAGGKGSNQAVAAARLGADVAFIGRLGNDVFAELAYEIWDAEGVDHRFVTRDNEVATGVAPILVDSGGENMIVVVLGANLRLRKSDIDAASATIADADILVVQREINLEIVPYALRRAKEYGVMTILNPAPAEGASQESLQLADILTPNEIELETLNGGEYEDVVSAARRLLKWINGGTVLQALLGVLTVLTVRSPAVASLHVLLGAALLAVALLFLLRCVPLPVRARPGVAQPIQRHG